jgi:hypothetical protein
VTREESRTLDAVGAQVDMLIELVREVRDSVATIPEKYATKGEVQTVRESIGWPKGFTVTVGLIGTAIGALVTLAIKG